MVPAAKFTISDLMLTPSPVMATSLSPHLMMMAVLASSLCIAPMSVRFPAASMDWLPPTLSSTRPPTIDIFDPITGEVRAMKLFVAAMGASNYTYAEACPSESLSDWIGVHTNLFRFLGGVPKFVVCDNLKAAVTNPDRYDPGLNRTYAEMASHYGTAILAARPRHPKDKAKVEVAVQIEHRRRFHDHRIASRINLARIAR